ncbi:MAG: helix-turn-helix domain-containing protein, partial [Patescibacteria group bacterium]
MKREEKSANQAEEKGQEGIEKYSPLSDLAKEYNISRDYLNTLVNRGRLKAKKIGRIWFSTREWLDEYLAEDGKNKKHKKESEDCLPLSELAEKYSISRDYLNTLVNRKKLKAKKIGRIWFSTSEWLEEYLAEEGKNKKHKKQEQEASSRKEKAVGREKFPEKPALINELVDSRREEEKIDWIFLEKGDFSKEAEARKDWEEKTGKAGKEIERKKQNIRPEKIKYFFRKVDFSSVGIRGAAICFISIVAAFSFFYFEPEVKADFFDMANKLIAFSSKKTEEVFAGAKHIASSTFKKVSTPWRGDQGLGRVAGISEAAGHSIIAGVQSFAYEMGGTTKDSILSVLQNLAEAQKDLSIKLGQEAADLTLSSAGRVKGVSETGEIKLAQLADKVGETNQGVKDYAQISKYSFLKEFSRSAQSLVNLYTRVVDFLTPNSLKKYYVYAPAEKGAVEIPVEEEKAAEEGKEGESRTAQTTAPVASKITAAPTPKSSGGTAGVPAVFAPAPTKIQPTVLQTSSDGTTNVDGNLMVKGAATFNDNLTVDDNLTVKGVIYGGSPVEIAGGLKVSGNAEFT